LGNNKEEITMTKATKEEIKTNIRKALIKLGDLAYTEGHEHLKPVLHDAHKIASNVWKSRTTKIELLEMASKIKTLVEKEL
jgi:hypothetical protein